MVGYRNIDKIKSNIGETVFNHINSLNKSQLEKQLSELKSELKTESKNTERHNKLKDEEWYILYKLERASEFKYAKGSAIEGGDWFWNQAYRHYMRDASKKDMDSVKQKFIKLGLPLNGESPKHAYIVVNTVSPKDLKNFEKISDTEIKYAEGGTTKGFNYSIGGL